MKSVLKSKFQELGPLLQRGFWQPLHRTMQIFHVLPLAAALLTFFLLATIGQLREIYLSFLESPSSIDTAWMASKALSSVSTVLVLALFSALLYVAHYGLSTMRVNVIYSSYSNPDAGSRVHSIQRIAAVGLALIPWFGLVAGLFGARNHLTETYDLLNSAKGVIPAPTSHLYAPAGWVIPASVLLQGIASAFFLDFFRQNRFVQWTVMVIGPTAAAALFLLLTHSSPGMGSATPWPVFVGVISIAVACCVLHVCFYKMRTNLIYARVLRPDHDTGVNLRRRRRIFLFFFALLPWLTIACYFVLPFRFAGDIAAPGTASWVIVPLAMAWTIAMGLTVAMLLDQFRESMALRVVVIGATALLVVVAMIASLYGAPAIVSVYRSVGPLGSIVLELLFVTSTLALLAWLSQKSGFPALTLVVLATVIGTIFPIPILVTASVFTFICGVIAVLAFLSHRYAVAVVAALMIFPVIDNLIEDPDFHSVKPLGQSDQDVCHVFGAWLTQLGKGPKAGDLADHCGQLATQEMPPDESKVTTQEQYPVFIIAVEGGGIYAAAAASLLLARLEDAVPGFSQHVFAISGVSGGAIGATVFQSLDRAAMKDHPPAPTAACPQSRAANGQPGAPTSLQHEVSKVMQDDHLSPVVASIFPAFFGAPTQRAETLAASFEDSVGSQNAAAAQELCDLFVDHWPPGSQAPALVLNTTWVETGFRVALAPFSLHDGGDQSLYSFSDQFMPGETDVSLMEAAIDSARFPGMLPSYAVTMNESTGNQIKKSLPWNFVDGGYSDNSGASTALDLYRALEPIAQRRDVDIKVILLTSSDPEPDLHPDQVQIKGTSFHDTLAPIDAIMSVRSGLGNEAVARACNFFYPEGSSNRSCNGPASTPGNPLQIVKIDDETFSLALGWKLSQTSFDVVSWMLGQPDLCNENADDNETPPAGKSSFELLFEQFGLARGVPPLVNKSIGDMVQSNSCVLKHVGDLVAGP